MAFDLVSDVVSADWQRHVDVVTRGHGAGVRVDRRLPRRPHRRRRRAEATPPAVLRRRRRESCWNGRHRSAARGRRARGQISDRRAGFSEIYRAAWRPTTRLLVNRASHRSSPTVGRHRPWRRLPSASHVFADVRRCRSSRTVSQSASAAARLRPADAALRLSITVDETVLLFTDGWSAYVSHFTTRLFCFLRPRQMLLNDTTDWYRLVWSTAIKLISFLWTCS